MAFIERNGVKERVNISNVETLTIKKKKNEIIVDSDLYNKDETYSKHIDNTLMSVFTSIGESYNN